MNLKNLIKQQNNCQKFYIRCSYNDVPLKTVLFLTVDRWRCTVITFGESTHKNDDISQVYKCMSDMWSYPIFYSPSLGFNILKFY